MQNTANIIKEVFNMRNCGKEKVHFVDCMHCQYGFFKLNTCDDQHHTLQGFNNAEKEIELDFKEELPKKTNTNKKGNGRRQKKKRRR